MSKSFFTQLAEAISIIFNPILLGLVIILVAVFRSDIPPLLRWEWLAIVIVLNGGALALIYWLLLKRGYVFDESVDNKAIKYQRAIFLLILLILVGLELLVLFNHPYQPFLAILVGGFLTTIIGMVITYFWKISWHSAMTTFFVTMLILLYGWKTWPSIILLLLILWSRLKLKRHTIWQLLGGVAISLVIMFVVFQYFALI